MKIVTHPMEEQHPCWPCENFRRSVTLTDCHARKRWHPMHCCAGRQEVYDWRKCSEYRVLEGVV